MSLFERQLKKCGQVVKIEDRDERIINGKAAEIFSNERERRALIKTVRGVTVFDSTNTERVATHKLCMLWEPGIGAEQWVELKGKRLKILTAENCCEHDRRLILMCTERGEVSKVVNRA